MRDAGPPLPDQGIAASLRPFAALTRGVLIYGPLNDETTRLTASQTWTHVVNPQKRTQFQETNIWLNSF